MNCLRREMSHTPRHKVTYGVLAAISFTVLGCQQENPPQWIKLPAEVKVEIARTPQERQTGLKFRRNLPKGEGMYFVFEEEQPLSFYMRDTRIPLSIAFINSDGIIESIRDMIPLDERSVPSARPAKFALEVRRGWFDENGIHPGDKVVLDGNRVSFLRSAGQ